MTYNTSGYLVKRIIAANENPSNEDHARASGYLTKFRAMESHFFDKVHPQVDAGLATDAVSDTASGEPSIMTIHGCRHVCDLVESLDKLSGSIEKKKGATPLNPLESYILLCAAHLHDAGNVGGRKDHEMRSGELIKKHRQLFYDTETRHSIYEVARVHRGEAGQYGKDTLRTIGEDNYSSPRLPLLASLLRMADELSESPDRVPQAILDWYETSPSSKLAHRYAQCFRGFNLENDRLDIQLRLYPEQHKFSTVISGRAVQFFEHLEHKIDVIEREAKYCSQYGRPDFDVRRIRVGVEYYRGAFPSQVTKRSSLTLYLDRGYPGELQPLSERCEELGRGKSFAHFCKGEV